MEGVDPRRQQQYEQSAYQPAQRYGANISGSNVPERYGQSQAQARQIPTTGPGAGVGSHGQALRVYPYAAHGQQQYAPQMQDTSMEYQSEFAQDAQRQQQFQAYSSGMMYNLPAQVQPAQQQPSSFDPVQQYQPRQSTAMDVLPNQFGVSQYYNTGEPTTAATQIAQTYASAQFQQQSSFQQSLSSNRPSESTPYVAGVGDYPQLAMSNVLEQQAEPSQDPSASEEPYKTYLESLKQTYQYAYDGRMIEAGQRLLDLSDWLIGHATALGLTRDEPELQSQRLKLWNDFNNCWLAVLQRQKDLTQQMIDTQQPPPENHTLLQEAFLERMARELVRMCDVMERHGLVDYEMGVWEEEIMNVLLDCLHLLEGDPDEPSGPSLHPISSHPRRSQ